MGEWEGERKEEERRGRVRGREGGREEGEGREKREWKGKGGTGRRGIERGRGGRGCPMKARRHEEKFYSCLQGPPNANSQT